MGNLIFILDDSNTVRASIKYTLTKAGFEVEMAEDGQDGIQKLNKLAGENRRPKMIISDVNMPKMDGITFIKEIKKDPKFKFIPVLVLTTESQNEKKMEGKNAGAAGWLVKPFKPDQLISVVKKFVR